jgi:hypothetical protein
VREYFDLLTLLEPGSPRIDSIPSLAIDAADAVVSRGSFSLAAPEVGLSRSSPTGEKHHPQRRDEGSRW